LEKPGVGPYNVFLQGSFRNDTAIADVNDVDIVALRMPPRNDDEPIWPREFSLLMEVLRESPSVTSIIEQGDKCIKVRGTHSADVVPAIPGGESSTTDPMLIHSIRDNEERPNYPWRHYLKGVNKQTRTGGTYKETVRILKSWIRRHPSLFAPSFYVECAVHSVDDEQFDRYPPRSFLNVAETLCSYSPHDVVMSVAGDKNILVDEEWPPSDFRMFQERLQIATNLIRQAMQASRSKKADELWMHSYYFQ
jgi:hypothetical protein